MPEIAQASAIKVVSEGDQISIELLDRDRQPIGRAVLTAGDVRVVMRAASDGIGLSGISWTFELAERIEAMIRHSKTTLAEIAVELGANPNWLGEQALAVLIETSVTTQFAHHFERIGERLGLTPEAVRAIMANVERRVDLLSEAHLLLRGLIPHESAVRELAAAGAAEVVLG